MCDFVQHPALGGEPVLRPQPLDVDQRRLPQTIDGMLKRGNGEGVVIWGGRLHFRFGRHSAPSPPFDDLYSIWKGLAVDFDQVIRVRPSGRLIIEPAVDLAELALDIASYPHPFE